MKYAFKTLAALSAVVAMGTAHASLVNLGDGTVKDTATNLIWLHDWMYDFNSNAQPCTWQCAMDWTADRTVAGATDWTLPTLALPLKNVLHS